MTIIKNHKKLHLISASYKVGVLLKKYESKSKSPENFVSALNLKFQNPCYKLSALYKKLIFTYFGIPDIMHIYAMTKIH